MQPKLEFRVQPSIDDAKIWFLVLIQSNKGRSERVNILLTSKTRKNFVALRSILEHKDPCEIIVLKVNPLSLPIAKMVATSFSQYWNKFFRST